MPLRFDQRKGRWPIVVDCGTDPRGIQRAIDSTEPDGVVHSVSYDPDPLTGVPLGKMSTLAVELHTGRVHSAAMLPTVPELLAEGRLRPDMVPTTTVAWDEAPARYLEPATKLVVAR